MIGSHNKKFWLSMRKMDLEMVKFYLEQFKKKGGQYYLQQAKKWGEQAVEKKRIIQSLSTS